MERVPVATQKAIHGSQILIAASHPACHPTLRRGMRSARQSASAQD
ncbi:hypothetical protein AB395_00003162 [Sinorhizobium fredii CCBAU 45436]|nr:hypothetical protein AB395_00003162 [Sinorhizobium fredii CCBAU 45436]